MSNRSNSKNPNHPAFKAGQDNRSNQLNPTHLPSKGGDSGTNSSSGYSFGSDLSDIPHFLEENNEPMAKIHRLGKVALEFNVSRSTIVDFLKAGKHDVEDNPNAKISEELYQLLIAEFNAK